MQIVWLGQGGLMLVSKKHKLLVDPYMTNVLKKLDKSYKRRVRIKKKYFKLKPDVILLTNSHPDHTDAKTLSKFIPKKKRKKRTVTVLSCESTYKELSQAKEFKRGNHILFGQGDEWTFGTINIRAIKARTNDRSAFGVLITDLSDGRKYYIASNTLYNEEIIDSIPCELFAAFIPISGTYGCMNMTDAQRFAKRLDASYVIPINYGMFDKINPAGFECAGKIIPKPYKSIIFDTVSPRPESDTVLDRRFNEQHTRRIKKKAKKIRKAELQAAKERKRLEKEEKRRLRLAEKSGKRAYEQDLKNMPDLRELTSNILSDDEKEITASINVLENAPTFGWQEK